jgi:AraC-like DNA-binding protein
MLRVLSAGRKFQPPGYRNDVHDYPQFMVLLVLEGELHVSSPDVQEIVTPNRVVILPPGVDVLLSSPRTGYRGFYVEGDRAQNDLPIRVHAMRADAAIMRMTADIETELAQPHEHDLCPLLYQMLLVQCLRRCRRQPRAQTPGQTVDHVLRLLRANLYQHAPLAEILAASPFSQRHLSRLFALQQGMSIKQRFLRLKVEEAGLLLRNPQLSITSIAFDLGFSSSQHFATAFTALAGMSPRAWRQRKNVGRIRLA